MNEEQKQRIENVEEMIKFWKRKSEHHSYIQIRPEILETIQYLIQLKIRLENK
jgi:hypothetical protein